MRESGPVIRAVGGRFLDLRADLLGAALDLLTGAGSFTAAPRPRQFVAPQPLIVPVHSRSIAKIGRVMKNS
jgi:hypothetical protein